MIVVTAPTSTIGRDLIENLLGNGESIRVIARDPARLAPGYQEQVDVVEGSHGDADVVDRAFEGAETVFWLAPAIPDAETADASFSGFTQPAADAFARRGVERVVGISALGRGTPMADEAGLVTASLAMDDLIAGSGVAYRTIACPSLMRNLLNHVGILREKHEFSMMIDPDLSAPWVTSRDVSAVCARLLLDGSWDGVEKVACLGPEDISPTEIAATLSELVGAGITYKQISGSTLHGQLTAFGYSSAMADGMVEMFEAKNAGLDNAEQRTNESSTPTTFKQWGGKILAPQIVD